MPAKPPIIVHARRPRRRPAKPATPRQPFPAVVTAPKPGRSRYRLEIPPAEDDPEATARVRAFLSRMIRSAGPARERERKGRELLLG